MKQKHQIEALNPYLDFLIIPNFEGVNRHFALLFENKENRTVEISNSSDKGL